MKSIFLNNVTLIDAAYIDADGRPRGVSINPSFIVSGEVDTPEQVVADFSSIKKTIKEMIDDKAFGFDHKLWVCAHQQGTETKITQKVGVLDSAATMELVTPHLRMTAPRNAYRILSKVPSEQPKFYQDIAEQLSAYLNVGLNPNGISVTVIIDDTAYLPGVVTLAKHCLPDVKNRVTRMFQYTHGLPNSSSWGCQNILHGHLSYLTLASSGEHNLDELANSIQQTLDNAYLYEEVDGTLDGSMFKFKQDVFDYGYTTERGSFFIKFDKGSTPEDTKFIGMAKAPTIENIVDHVIDMYRTQLREKGVQFIAISEGLWKGSHRTCLEADWK